MRVARYRRGFAADQHGGGARPGNGAAVIRNVTYSCGRRHNYSIDLHQAASHGRRSSAGKFRAGGALQL